MSVEFAISTFSKSKKEFLTTLFRSSHNFKKSTLDADMS